MADALLLTEKLDLSAAAPLAEMITINGDDDVTLDAQHVTHLGALCLQVMLAASAELRKSGHSLRLINTSDRVVNNLRLMGTSPEALAEGII